jgi:hypothetical protein
MKSKKSPSEELPEPQKPTLSPADLDAYIKAAGIVGDLEVA